MLYYPPILKNLLGSQSENIQHHQELHDLAVSVCNVNMSCVWKSQTQPVSCGFMCTWAPANGSNLAACCQLQQNKPIHDPTPRKTQQIYRKNGGISVVEIQNIQTLDPSKLRFTRVEAQISHDLWISLDLFLLKTRGVFIRRLRPMYMKLQRVGHKRCWQLTGRNFTFCCIALYNVKQQKFQRNQAEKIISAASFKQLS